MKVDPIIQDSLGWDVQNWSQCFDFWQLHSQLKLAESSALEIGAGGKNGGISLWLASKGASVTCSNVEPPHPDQINLHANAALCNEIKYEQLDATRMGVNSTLDLICCKSVFGGIGRWGQHETIQNAVSEIHRALKPNGEFWFAENLPGSVFHQFLRNRFGAARKGWNYLNLGEYRQLFGEFSELRIDTFGTSGCFGPDEFSRRYLGYVDKILLDRITPESWRYIAVGIARK